MGTYQQLVCSKSCLQLSRTSSPQCSLVQINLHEARLEQRYSASILRYRVLHQAWRLNSRNVEYHGMEHGMDDKRDPLYLHNPSILQASNDMSSWQIPGVKLNSLENSNPSTCTCFSSPNCSIKEYDNARFLTHEARVASGLEMLEKRRRAWQTSTKTSCVTSWLISPSVFRTSSFRIFIQS